MNKVAIISSSLRETRKSHRVALYIERMAQQLGCETIMLDLKAYNFPLFTERLIHISHPSNELLQFAHQITTADTILIVTPEYNGSYPAALKNVIDLFVEQWRGKSVGIATASIGPYAGKVVMNELQSLLFRLKAKVCTEAFNVALIDQFFTEEGTSLQPELTDKFAIGFLHSLLSLHSTPATQSTATASTITAHSPTATPVATSLPTETTDRIDLTEKLTPILFVGHGAAENLWSQNSYHRDIRNLGQALPTPRAILVISSHWISSKTAITTSNQPAQIFDFYSLEDHTQELHYPLIGSESIAQEIIESLSDMVISKEPSRGIDHGAWGVARELFPTGGIPIIELSIDINQPPQYHYNIGKKLQRLRQKEILIIGSGNMVHNLFECELDIEAPIAPFAKSADDYLRQAIENREDDKLINYPYYVPDATSAIPQPDHYLPLLYILGARVEQDRLSFYHSSIQMGTVSMRGFILG